MDLPLFDPIPRAEPAFADTAAATGRPPAHRGAASGSPFDALLNARLRDAGVPDDDTLNAAESEVENEADVADPLAKPHANAGADEREAIAATEVEDIDDEDEWIATAQLVSVVVVPVATSIVLPANLAAAQFEVPLVVMPVDEALNAGPIAAIDLTDAQTLPFQPIAETTQAFPAVAAANPPAVRPSEDEQDLSAGAALLAMMASVEGEEPAPQLAPPAQTIIPAQTVENKPAELAQAAATAVPIFMPSPAPAATAKKDSAAPAATASVAPTTSAAVPLLVGLISESDQIAPEIKVTVERALATPKPAAFTPELPAATNAPIESAPTPVVAASQDRTAPDGADASIVATASEEADFDTATLVPVDDEDIEAAPASQQNPLPLPSAPTAPAAVQHAAATAPNRPIVHPVVEQVVIHIAKAAADAVEQIKIELRPAELGRVDVRMEIGPNGHVQAVFAADRPQTLELLQRDARQLERALQDAGLNVGSGSLSFDLRGNGREHAGGNGTHSPNASPAADMPQELAGVASQAYAGLGSASGRIDIRV
jgi:flagellar hook-length control protein FliK